jgi:hypothetical protein
MDQLWMQMTDGDREVADAELFVLGQRRRQHHVRTRRLGLEGSA